MATNSSQNMCTVSQQYACPYRRTVQFTEIHTLGQSDSKASSEPHVQNVQKLYKTEI